MTIFPVRFLSALAWAVLVCGCSLGSQSSPDFGYQSRNGAAEAKEDIKKGELALKVYGLPDPATEKYAELLKSRMNVNYQPIALCEVDLPLIKYANRYNAVVSKVIAKKYGPTALDDLWNEARREYERESGAPR